jgi:hypothetical protein
MKQYTPEEIQQLLTVKGGTAEEQAAALAVVESAILESRRLGRIATRPPKSSWHKSDANLRSNLNGNWGSISGR